MVFKIMTPNTIRIADLKNRQMEELAQRYDNGSKGYLTTDEAYALFADNNQDAMPSHLGDVINFLGGKQHNLTVHHQGWGEVMSLPWHVHDWAGDFSVPGLGAGNVRIGGIHNWERPDDPKGVAFLFDCNLVDIGALENKVTGATLVVGPAGFNPDDGSSLGEAVDIPLTLATQGAHQTWTRAGSSWVPEKKFLAASVDADDLASLSKGDGLSFYVRLDTTEGPKWINKDGVSGRNFDVSEDQLNKYRGE